MAMAELNLRIMKIAALGGFFVSACGYYFKVQIDDRLRESAYYKKAVAHLIAHRPLLDFMGEPIKFKNANLSDRSKNYTIDTSEANFEIPIVGTLRSGIMHFKAVRTMDDNQPPAAEPSKESNLFSWKVVKLEVSINGRPGERIVVPIKPLPLGPPPNPQVTKLNPDPVISQPQPTDHLSSETQKSEQPRVPTAVRVEESLNSQVEAS